MLYENKPRAQTKEESAPAVRRNARPKRSSAAAPDGGSGLPAPPAAPLRTASPPTNAYGRKNRAKRFSTRPKQEAHPPARPRAPSCTFTNSKLRFRRRRCRLAPTARAPLSAPSRHRSSDLGSNCLPRRETPPAADAAAAAGTGRAGGAVAPQAGPGSASQPRPGTARVGWGGIGSGRLELEWLR